MPARPYNVLCRPPGEGWQPMTSRPYGVQHSHVAPGGPADLAFNVNRPTDRRYPDLTPGTRIAGVVAGVPVWTGQIVRAQPEDAGTWNVEARGMVRHLQEDVLLDRIYAREGFRDFVDQRELPGAPLTVFTPPWKVDNQGFGVASLGIAKGDKLTASSVGMTLDAGPNSTFARIALTIASVTGMSSASWTLRVRGHNTPNANTAFETLVTDAAIAATTHAVNMVTPRRYVTIMVSYTGPTGESVADRKIVLSAFRAWASAAYASGSTSVLKASSVAEHVFGSADADLVSTVGAVTAGAINIADMDTEGWQSGYDMIERANDVERYEWAYQPGLKPIPYFRPASTGAPLYVARMADAQRVSASGDLSEIFNRVIVRYPVGSANTAAETIRTLTPDTTPLKKLGVTRTAILEIRRETTLATAQAIGDAFLRDAAILSARRPVTFHGSIPMMRGGSAPLAFLRAYDRILLPWETNPQGAPGRVGLVTNIGYDHDANSLSAEIDTRFSSFDKQMARFELTGRWGQ